MIKELLAIVDAFEEWHHLLEGVQHEIVVIPNDATFFCQIREDLKKNSFIIGIYGQLRNYHQVQDFSNDHVKFEFQNGLLYCDGFWYVHDGLAQLQMAKALCLAIGHFGFNKTMELVFKDYLVAIVLEVYEGVY
jgi:hypothetical protein